LVVIDNDRTPGMAAISRTIPPHATVSRLTAGQPEFVEAKPGEHMNKVIVRRLA
jgi:hypothetical protein